MDEVAKTKFCLAMDEVSSECAATAREKGFWDNPRNFGEMIALMHSELSECLEGYRSSKGESDKIPEFFAVEEELADVIIRILDLAYTYSYKLPEAILAKMEYNKGREHKHGKQF